MWKTSGKKLAQLWLINLKQLLTYVWDKNKHSQRPAAHGHWHWHKFNWIVWPDGKAGEEVPLQLHRLSIIELGHRRVSHMLDVRGSEEVDSQIYISFCSGHPRLYGHALIRMENASALACSPSKQLMKTANIYPINMWWSVGECSWSAQQ